MSILVFAIYASGVAGLVFWEIILLSSDVFRKLVDEHGRLVLNTAFGVLGDHAGAEDVHQEVFMAIWRNWHTYNGDTKWRGYLYRATIRKAIDHAKRIRRDKGAVKDLQLGVDNRKPDGEMIASQMQDKLRMCIGNLPKRQAEVFVMARIDGLAYDKIGKVLDCSAKTVRVHMHRALKKLAKEFTGAL
ncbi:MAG: RNA polymerase sigma factor [Planctomycetes bacterium]|nr:RNA polymerase sigma factor [Planctomycetota bacterium]